LRQSRGAHFFRDALDQLGAHCARCLGRDIAFGDTRPTDGDNQLHLLAPVRQGCFDFGLIVGNNLVVSDLEAVLAQQVSRRRTGEIGPLASGTGIADGKNGGGWHKVEAV
jgi:hypothetical protein